MSSILTKSAFNNFLCFRTFNNPLRNNLFIRCQQRNFAFSFENDDDNDSSSPNNFNSFSNRFQNNSNFVRRQNSYPKNSRFQKQNIKWAEEHLTQFKKDFYQENPNLKKMTSDEIKKLRQELSMMVFGKDIPTPFRTFDESGIPARYLEYLRKLGIDTPTPIQQQGIPTALTGRDVVGVSRTGSGKTLAYLLPCIVHIAAQPPVQKNEGPIGLVLAPTRELVCQIADEIQKLTQFNREESIKHCAVYGGTDRQRQLFSLKQSPDILVATPGRLMDLLETGATNFKRTTYCVLDEADRMLDMGFRDDIETILSYIRPDKQTLMWSATWPSEIQSIASNYMKDPIRIQIGSTELFANSNIRQSFRLTNDNGKLNFLIKDCKELAKENKKILIFSNRKKTADYLEDILQSEIPQLRGRVSAIHSDKSQSAREKILNSFRSNKIRILIATDVVARGIDINDIDCIIIYDFPGDIESYVHRIGRTARGNNEGLSLSYLTNADIVNIGSKLVKVLEKSKQSVPKWLQAKAF